MIARPNRLRAEDAIYTGSEETLAALPVAFDRATPEQAAPDALCLGRPVVALDTPTETLLQRACELDVPLYRAELGQHRLELGADSVAFDVENLAEIVEVEAKALPVAKDDWPAPIPSSAWQGWLRAFMEKVAPQTEADSNALLVDIGGRLTGLRGGVALPATASRAVRQSQQAAKRSARASYVTCDAHVMHMWLPITLLR